MTNKIALISGSSRGIGLAIAQSLAKHGIQVILTGRSQKTLDNAMQKLIGTNHIAHVVDFCQKESIDGLLNRIIEQKIIPTIIIHNVGGTIANDNFPMNLAVLKETMLFNVEAALGIDNVIFPHMIKNQFGRIIHIGSDASLTGKASPAYVVAKAALNGYIKTSARYYAKHNIMICGVLPGIIEHEDSVWSKKKIQQPLYYSQRLSETSLGRFGTPEEIASFVTELALSNNMMCSGSLFELQGT